MLNRIINNEGSGTGEWTLLSRIIWLKATVLAAAGAAWHTVTGAIVQFVTVRAAPIKELVVNVDPVQDLHGYDRPWPEGGGDNKLPPAATAETKTASTGFKVTSYADGHYHLSKTASGASDSVSFDLANSAEASSGMYFIPKCSISNGSVTISIRDASNNVIKEAYLGNTSPTAIGTTGTATKIVFFVAAAVDSIEVDVYPMLGASVLTSWSPYSNEGPISGWTGANISRTGENLFNIVPDEIKTISFYTAENPVIQYRYGFEFLLPAGTYTINAEFKGTPESTFIYGGVYKKSGLRVNQLNVVAGTTITPRTITIADDERIIYYDANNSTLEAAKQAFGRLNMWVNVGSSAPTFAAYVGNTYQIDWTDEAGTVYKGTMTIKDDGSATLVSTYADVDLSTMTWTTAGSGRHSANNPVGIKTVGNAGVVNALCSQYIAVRGGDIQNTDMSLGMVNSAQIQVNDTRLNGIDADDFKTAMNGVKMVYELATPVTYDLTPQQVISTLQGYNNVWANTGDVTVTFRGTPIVEPDEQPLQALNLLLGGAYRNNQTAEDVPDEEALDILLGGADR